MFTNAVVTELKKIASESIDATRSNFPDRDVWRKLDANVMKICFDHGIYAYGAHFLDCSLRFHAPLFTLDKKLKQTA